MRTEADELTYPLHILIRYEIEKGLFDGSISTEGLDKTWNAKYKEYLGIDVPNDRLGILQDGMCIGQTEASDTSQPMHLEQHLRHSMCMQ